MTMNRIEGDWLRFDLTDFQVNVYDDTGTYLNTFNASPRYEIFEWETSEWVFKEGDFLAFSYSWIPGGYDPYQLHVMRTLLNNYDPDQPAGMRFSYNYSDVFDDGTYGPNPLLPHSGLWFVGNSEYGYFGGEIDEITSSAAPIPGAVWLLGSGLVGLVGLRRKLKS